MQRYRVNYRLLVGLFVSFVALAVASFLIWNWQVNRKATWFRDSAKLARDEGKQVEAFDLLLKYVQLRRDEVEPRIELSHIGLELINDQDTKQELRGQAFAVLEETVRRTGDPELTREFIKIIISFRPQDALGHLDELLREKPDDSELLAMQAQALYRVKGNKPALDLCYKLVGYDQVKRKFDSAKSKVKDRPEVYSMLAGLIIEKDKDDEALAEQVLDEMIEVNPDSAQAYLNRAIFLRTVDRKEESNEALDKAYELDPDNADILQQKGAVAFDEKDYDKAEEIFKDAIVKHPDRMVLYDLLSRAQIQNEQLDDALATLEQGVQKIGPDRALVFSRSKINIYLQRGDYAGVEKELEKLTKVRNPALEPFINFTRARIVWQKQEWSEAARELKDVRPKLIDYPQEQAMAGALLATCFERQGKYDLARQIYTEVIEKHPNYEAAKMGLQSLNDRLGLYNDEEAGDLDKAIDEMTKLPESQQNWTKIDEMVNQIAEERDFTEARLKLVRANVLIKRKKFAEAKELIREAALLEKDNIGVWSAAVALLSADPESGPQRALEQLANMEKKFGDSLRIRAMRAQLLRTVKGPNVVEELSKLTDGIDSWSKPEQAELMANIAAQFEQMQDYDKAGEYLKRTIEILPDSLPARIRLFEIAFQRRDVEAMKEAEKSILDLVKDADDGNYIYCQVRRLMWEFSQQEISREELADFRKRLDAALKRRPQWAELHVLYGQLLLLLEEDQEVALQHLEEALKYGPPNANALSLQVKLLGQRNQFAEAREKLDMIPEKLRQQLLGRSNAEILLLTGDKDDAFEAAKELAESETENATTQVWFARIANEVGKTDEAVAALTKATELQPTDADIWMQLLAAYASTENVQGVEDSLRKAQLSIEGDFLPLLTAKKYELMGDWRAAEKLYFASFADRLDEPAIAQKMAEFYLLWAQAGKTTNRQAAPYINRILRQANEGKLEQDNPYVSWARDRAARLLAASGDYQESLRAQRLLGGEGDLKNIPRQQKALLAEILASRNEPQAQLKAISILSEMDKAQTISREGVLYLAKLLGKAGNWQRCQDLMLNAIANFGKDEQVRATYINLLIERGEFTKANSQLDELKEINPNSSAYISLNIKLAAASGNRNKLRSLLQSMIPRNLAGAMDKKQLEQVLMVARLATEHEEYELASVLYGTYVQRDPSITLEFVRYMALHGDPSLAMNLLKQSFAQDMDETLRICAEMLRARRVELGDKFDAEVDELIAAALRDDPDSVRRMLVEAEVLEIQAKYEESVAKYDSVLKRDDVPRMMRAAAMNNLGFLLTLLGQRTDEAEQLINDAMEVYGPVSDILDTRAVVYITRKQYDQAVEDMSLATSLSDDPIKFYHYAQANLLAGNDQAALKAWERALKLGIAKEKLPVLEQKNYDQVKSEIEGLRTQNAKL